MTDDNNTVMIAADYLIGSERKENDADYLRGRADGMEYVIDSIAEAFKGKESER